MKALITAGGHGTRLRPITHTQNKHLIPIANKPMLEYAIEYVRDAGVSEVGIIIKGHGLDSHLQEIIGDGSRFGVKITYIEQLVPGGLAQCVQLAEDFIAGDEFIFYLGDNIIVGGISQFVEEFRVRKSNCHLVLARVPDPERFGVPEIQGNQIIGVEEKPQNPKSDFAVTGIYIYDSSIFEAVKSIKPSARGELEISDAHQWLLDQGKSVSFSEITGWWKDTGKPNDLLEANRLMLDSIQSDIRGEVDELSSIEGRVQIGDGSTVTNSIVRGPAVIGKNVILKNVYIGPFTSISDDCIVENSEVEFS
ncbi:glucose-1-phosphate thymidylyltransferase, partial [bacterium]|nr:glucose-1-phosphate thymidylyltransferase [bacterium]